MISSSQACEKASEWTVALNLLDEAPDRGCCLPNGMCKMVDFWVKQGQILLASSSCLLLAMLKELDTQVDRWGLV